MNFLTYQKRINNVWAKSYNLWNFNVAHKDIDLKNWKTNRKNSGFLPEEEMVQPHTKNGFLDVFREIVNESAIILGGQTAQCMPTMLLRIDYQFGKKYKIKYFLRK